MSKYTAVIQSGLKDFFVQNKKAIITNCFEGYSKVSDTQHTVYLENALLTIIAFVCTITEEWIKISEECCKNYGKIVFLISW